MANKNALVINNGQVEQLQVDDDLDVTVVTQPNTNNSKKTASTAFVNNLLSTYVEPTIINVKQGGTLLANEFSSIASAVNSIIDSSILKPYVIKVQAGIYIEPIIDLYLKQYIQIVGASIIGTVIQPDSVSHDVIRMGQNCEISFLTIQNAGAGFAGILCDDIGNFAQVHKVSMFNNDTNVKCISRTQDTIIYLEFVDVDNTYNYGIHAIANNNFKSIIDCDLFYAFPTGTTPSINVLAEGNGAYIRLIGGCGVVGNTFDTACYAKNFGEIEVIGSDIESCAIGGRVEDNGQLTFSNSILSCTSKNIWIPNIGANANLRVNACILESTLVTNDVLIESTSSFGFVIDSVVNTIKSSSVSSNFAINWSDPVNYTTNVLGDFTLGRDSNALCDVTDLVLSQGMGVITGGGLTAGTGLVLNIANGIGYCMFSNFPIQRVRKFSWINSTLNLIANSELYIFINTNGLLSQSTSRPDIEANILLGRVVTNATNIILIDEAQIHAHHTINKLSEFARDVFGAQFESGGIVSENTTPFHLNVLNGNYYLGEKAFSPSGGNNIAWSEIYQSGTGSWVINANINAVQLKYDNNSGTLQNLNTGMWTNHTLYLVGDGVNEKYFLVYGQVQYATQLDAKNAPIPLEPSYFTQSVVKIATILVQQGSTNIGNTNIIDIRPAPASKAPSTSAVTDHQQLSGRNLPSGHSWALDINGSNSMQSNLNMATFQITNAGLINNVNIANHASRHQHGGADEIATVTPIGSGIPKAQPSGILASGWGGITGSFVGTTDAQNLTNKILTNPKINTILDTNGLSSLQFTPTLNAVNFLNIINSITGVNPQLNASGTDANIGLNITTKGLGVLQANGNSILNYPSNGQVIGTSTIMTTSQSPILATGMQITVAQSGTYLVFFIGQVFCSTGAGSLYLSIYANNVISSTPQMQYYDANGLNQPNIISTMAIVTLLAGQTIQGRWRVDSFAGTGTMINRQMIILKVG